MMFEFIGTCATIPSVDVPHLREMTESARRIEYETMRRALRDSHLDLITWSQSYAGYDRNLSLRQDWHVSYHRSTWKGRPCLYLRWSGFEVIWAKEVA